MVFLDLAPPKGLLPKSLFGLFPYELKRESLGSKQASRYIGIFYPEMPRSCQKPESFFEGLIRLGSVNFGITN